MKLSNGPGGWRELAGGRADWIILLTYLSLAVSLGYATFAHRPDLARGDVPHYVAMARAGADAAPEPFRFRVLTPALAALIPASLLDRLPIATPLAEESSTLIRFALVNLVGLALAAHFMFLMLRRMAFRDTEAFLSGCLFLLLLPVATWAPMPMTEAWAYALLAGSLWALLAGRLALLVLFVSLGLLQKETILLVPVALALWPGLTWKRSLLVAAPILAYMAVRLGLGTGGSGAGLASATAYISRLASGGTPNVAFHAPFTFGMLWLLAAGGWSAAASIEGLDRWRWLLIPILIAPFVFVVDIPRVWTHAFPVVIPLALLGLRRVLEQDAVAGRVSAA